MLTQGRCYEGHADSGMVFDLDMFEPAPAAATASAAASPMQSRMMSSISYLSTLKSDNPVQRCSPSPKKELRSQTPLL